MPDTGRKATCGLNTKSYRRCKVWKQKRMTVIYTITATPANKEENVFWKVVYYL